MKLSDEKLTKLLTPLITKEVEAYGLEKLTIEGKLDQSGEDAIYFEVWLREIGDDYSKLFLGLNRIIRDFLEDKDDRAFQYVGLHSKRINSNFDYEAFLQTFLEKRVAA